MRFLAPHAALKQKNYYKSPNMLSMKTFFQVLYKVMRLSLWLSFQNNWTCFVLDVCYRRASSLGIAALIQSNAWPVMRHFKAAWWCFDVLSCVCRAEDVFGPCGHRGTLNTGCYSSYFAASAVKDGLLRIPVRRGVTPLIDQVHLLLRNSISSKKCSSVPFNKPLTEVHPSRSWHILGEKKNTWYVHSWHWNVHFSK